MYTNHHEQQKESGFISTKPRNKLNFNVKEWKWNVNTVNVLIHWDQAMHCIWVTKLGNNNIDPDKGLSPVRRQAIVWTNAGV